MISLENYFEKGFEVTHLNPELVTKLWQIVYTTDWIKGDQSVHKSIPSWCQTQEIKYTEQGDGSDRDSIERTYGKYLLTKCPSYIKDVAHEIINLEYFDNLRFFKKQTELRYIHIWNGAEEIPWHQDASDGSDMLILVYLTEELFWDNSWGGYIELRKELSEQNMYQTLVQPITGNMIVINNANPLIKHRVHELKNQNVNRYTFSFCFSWLT